MVKREGAVAESAIINSGKYFRRENRGNEIHPHFGSYCRSGPVGRGFRLFPIFDSKGHFLSLGLER